MNGPPCECGCGSNVKPGNRFVNGHNRPGTGAIRTAVEDRPFPPPNPAGLCMCGCGLVTATAPQATVSKRIEKGQHFRYAPSHSPKTGSGTGGIDPSSGRFRVSQRNGKKRYRYQLVAEAMLGRSLRSGEVVHHINDDPADDRPENLEVMTRAEHTRLHNPKKGWRKAA